MALVGIRFLAAAKDILPRPNLLFALSYFHRETENGEKVVFIRILT